MLLNITGHNDNKKKNPLSTPEPPPLESLKKCTNFGLLTVFSLVLQLVSNIHLSRGHSFLLQWFHSFKNKKSKNVVL